MSFFVVLGQLVLAQGYVSGTIFDVDNQPLPYVNVYVKEMGIGVTSKSDGKYTMNVPEGSHELVFSFVGYKQKIVTITVRDGHRVIQNVWLETNDIELKEVMVNSKRRDPAYEIMQQVIEHKDRYRNQFQNSSSEVYIRAVEIKDKRSKKPVPDENEGRTDGYSLEEQENTKADNEPKGGSYAEIKMTRHYQPPNKVKEITTGKKIRGSRYGLFYLTTTTGEFDFYDNIISIRELGETPFISPLSKTAILTYKFQLKETFFDDLGRMMYRIQFKPRKQGNASFSGELIVYDKFWSLVKITADFEKGNLIKYDRFSVNQEYTCLQDSIWVINKQVFEYYYKTSKEEFPGKTTVIYSDYKFNTEHAKKFFNNELAVITQEAYDRDSAYWNAERPEPLSPEEQRVIATQDSIYARITSKEYLDSVDRDFNKPTLDKLFWHGQGYRNRDKKKELWFGSIPDYIRPFAPGGFRFGPYFSYFKKFENEHFIALNTDIDYGFRNEDIKGSIRADYRYNPFKMATVTAKFKHNFDVINPFDSYLNMIRRSNFIETTDYMLAHKFEVINGLYFYTGATLNHRKPITGYKFGDIADEFIANNTPTEFQAYYSLIADVKLSYTIKQQYIREPKRKLVLGSKWPTVVLTYSKGIDRWLGSDIDFDYFEFEVFHQINVGTVGRSNYRLATGKFLNHRDLRLVDYRYHRQGDVWLYSNPLYTFQLVERTMSSRDIFYEAHYIHHFNGAIMNNIPYLKKTRMTCVAGGGGLFIEEFNYSYIEAFFGVERIFKMNRRRFRLGAYWCVAETSDSKPRGTFKFSFEFFSNRENKWRF